MDFIESFLQANIKHRVFVKFDNIYGEYLPDYANYFGGPLKLKSSMSGMTNPGDTFADKLTNWLIYGAGFKQSQCRIYIYYNYASYGSKLVVLSYVDECVYWYISK